MDGLAYPNAQPVTVPSLRARISASLEGLLGQTSAYELAIVATLLTLILYAPKPWYAKAPIVALAVSALLLPALRANRLLWFSTTVLSAGYLLLNYHSADNHKWLLCYWSLAVFLSLHARNPAATLAENGRLLIGLAMALAVLWKLLAADYMSGEFFAHELLFDPRLRSVGRTLAGVTDEMFEANRAALDRLTDAGAMSASFATTPSVLPLAKAISAFGLAIELSIAVAFLAPAGSWAGRHRDLALQLFLLLIYPVTTVMGFAYILAAMGVAQARAKRNVAIYVGLLVLMQLYTMKWGLFL